MSSDKAAMNDWATRQLKKKERRAGRKNLLSEIEVKSLLSPFCIALFYICLAKPLLSFFGANGQSDLPDPLGIVVLIEHTDWLIGGLLILFLLTSLLLALAGFLDQREAYIQEQQERLKSVSSEQLLFSFIDEENHTFERAHALRKAYEKRYSEEPGSQSGDKADRLFDAAK